jgi:23S rRNA pseudouridine2604 synthase
MIEKGWVSVEGRVAIPGDRAAPDASITLSPEAKAQLNDTFTVVLNKPRGFVSSPDETGGARAMSLLVPDNFCGLGNPPGFSTFGLRVAGRLSVNEGGLVVFTTDTALARRLAAAGVDESWRIDFAAAPLPDTAETIVAQLTAMRHSARVDVTGIQAITLTTSSLGKGQLAALCGVLGLHADVTRLRRGEIAMPVDMPEGRWQLA